MTAPHKPRPDGCYRWVQFVEGAMPEIAKWEGKGWSCQGDDGLFPRVHKVGIGGTLDVP